MTGPDPNSIHPNPAISQVVFIKNVLTRPNILAGDYTYYDDPDGAEKFEEHVTHHYEFLGDKLIIGKFCAIARGVEFIMNGANHRMNSVTTYPFNIMGGGWEAHAPQLSDLPLKGDTVVGNDVWVCQHVTSFPACTSETAPSLGPIPSWQRTFRLTASRAAAHAGSSASAFPTS